MTSLRQGERVIRGHRDRVIQSLLSDERCQIQETRKNERIRRAIVLSESVINGFYCMYK